MRVLVWHAHGSWTTAFVQGPHTYVVPVVPGRGRDGRGRARTWDWPDRVVELAPEDLARTQVDVVVVQRPEDERLARAWLGGRRPGRDLPMIWLEHNAPQGRINDMRHAAADRSDVTLVHVSHTNALFWDCGSTRAVVVEHGVVDPGHRYSGELSRAVVVVNEPARRGRVTGCDLIGHVAATTPVDLFGMRSGSFAARARRRGCDVVGHEDLPQGRLHEEMARRRAYLHPVRWTSLGLSLIEAMHLGMPVIALATTEVPEAVPPQAGVVTNRVERLSQAVQRLVDEPDRARQMGRAARAAALERYGLARFLSDWDRLLEEVVR